jgi:DNA polymerase I-like protein with 3'-5' exonuclease and polymerase domains
MSEQNKKQAILENSNSLAVSLSIANNSDLSSHSSHNSEIKPHHRAEWQASGISDEIIDLNLRSVSSQESHYLLNLSKQPQHLLDGLYADVLADGGWSCQGCFKADKPLRTPNKTRYINTVGSSPEPIELRMPERFWQEIAEHYYLAPKPLELDGYIWTQQNPVIPVVVVEGVKKAACLMSHYPIVAIAVQGHSMAYKAEGDLKFKKYIHQSREVFIAFDQDVKISTREAVEKTIKGIIHRCENTNEAEPEVVTDKTGELEFKVTYPYNCKLKILTWYGSKGLDDYLVKNSFNPSLIGKLFFEAIPAHHWVPTAKQGLGFEPDVLMNSTRFENVVIPDGVVLVVIKAPKGTGKTWYAGQLVAQAKAKKKPIIFCQHRIELARGNAQRLDLTYVGDSEEKINNISDISLCINSLWKLKPEDFKGALFVIDEIVSTLHDLMLGSPCKSKRKIILERFQEICTVIQESGGQIVVLDADLNYRSLQMLRGMLKGTKPFVIENVSIQKGFQFALTDEIGCIKATEKSLADSKKVLLHLTSQKSQYAYSTTTLEIYFKQKFPHLKIVRIDSDTTKLHDHEAFKACSRINELVLHADLIIASPTISTGVSIENVGVELVVSIDNGVASPESARQTLIRLRDLNVPRILCIAERGLNSHLTKFGTSEQQVSKKYSDDFKSIAQSLDDTDVRWRNNFPEIEAAMLPRDYVNCLVAERNEQVLNHLKYVLFGLLYIEHNQLVTLSELGFDAVNIDEVKTVKAEISKVKEANDSKTKNDLIACEAHNIADEDYQKLKAQTSFTQEESTKLNAAVITKRYGGLELTESLINADRDGLRAKWRLLYLGTKGQEIAGIMKVLRAKNTVKRSSGKVIQHDFVQDYAPSLKLDFINKSGVLEIAKPGYIINALDEISVGIASYLQDNLKGFNELFGLKITSDKAFNIKCLIALINALGLNILSGKDIPNGIPKQLRREGKLVRNYVVANPSDIDIVFTFDKWLEQDSKCVNEWEKVVRIDEIEKLITFITDDNLGAESFNKLKTNELFDDAWERTLIKDRTSRINKLDNVVFCDSKKIFIDALDINGLNKCFEHLKSLKVAAIDTETYGNDKPNKNGITKEGLHKAKGQIRLIQISDANTTYTIDFGSRKSLSRHQALENFKPLFNALLARKDFTVVGHNLCFDNGFWKHTFNTQAYCKFEDTLLGFKIFFGHTGDAGWWSGGFKLGTLVEMFLDIPMDKTEQKSDWGGVLTQSQIDYAALDPHRNFLLWQFLHKLYKNPSQYGFHKLSKWNMLPAWELENSTIEPLNTIEFNGLPICETALNDLQNKTTEAIKINLDKWNSLVNNSDNQEKFAPTQTKKLVPYLNEKHGLNLKNAEKKVLGDFAYIDEIQLRFTHSSLQNYSTRLKKLSLSLSTHGRAKTFFNPLTGTGRTSSGGKFTDIVNIQSIPAKVDNNLKALGIPSIRSIFKVKNGRALIVSDLAAAHARIACDFANDETGKKAQNDDSIDAHSVFAILIAQSMPLKFIEKGLPARFVLHNLDVKIDVEQLRLDYAANKDNFESILNQDGINKYLLADVTIADKAMLKDFKASTKSIDICSQLRGLAKNIFYAKLNGASWGRIKAELAGQIKISATDAEAQLASTRFDNLYPQLAAYCKNAVEQLTKEENQIWINGQLFGISEIAETGQRLLFNLKVSKDGEVSIPATKVIASQWSRTEASVMKRSLSLVHQLIRHNPQWDAQLVNLVHDELNIECPETQAPEVAKMVSWVMAREFKKELKNGVTHGGTDFKNEHQEKYLLDESGNILLDSKGKGKPDDRFNTSIYSIICDNWGAK